VPLDIEHGGEKRRNHAGEHRVEGPGQQIRRRRADQTGQIEQETQEKEPDRKVDEHRVERMPE